MCPPTYADRRRKIARVVLECVAVELVLLEEASFIVICGELALARREAHGGRLRGAGPASTAVPQFLRCTS